MTSKPSSNKRRRRGKGRQASADDRPNTQTASARSQTVSSAPDIDTTPDEPEPQPGHVLQILSGLHAGASRPLAAQEMLLLGSGEDCDIVLSDEGVARHHAMILRHGDTFTLRAIDAPLGIAGHPLPPGDPVALPQGQRIDLGDVAFAVAAADDPGWATLLPGSAPPVRDDATPPPDGGGARRPRILAALAILAACSLVSVAIFAAVLPSRDAAPADPKQQLTNLAQQYRISNGRTTVDAAGNLTLTGTVRDSATRERIRQQLAEKDIDAQLDLRTGDDIAADVREVLRSLGIDAKTRYLGNGNVEVSGRFVDAQALKAAATSRAMDDVDGVRQLSLPEAVRTAAKAEQTRKTEKKQRIVSIVRGEKPYVLTADGNKYPVGAELPGGHGTLVAIGSKAWALVDGRIHLVEPEPAPADADTITADSKATDKDANPAATAKADSSDDADGETGKAATQRPARAVASTDAKPTGADKDSTTTQQM